MRKRTWRTAILGAAFAAIALIASRAGVAIERTGWSISNAPNPNGFAQTYDTNGVISSTNEFFQPLGSNGRACVTCHAPTDGWSVTPPNIQARFTQTSGTDPIFRTVDGSNCDNLDVSTVSAEQSAYSLLLNNGLIRVALPVPAGAEFTVTNVQNYYGDCNSTTTLSVYRRPLPAANLRFLTSVQWDGRESFPPTTEAITAATNPGDLYADLAHQALDAALSHEQATVPPTAQQQQSIVNFEMGLSNAQAYSSSVGFLNGGDCWGNRPGGATRACAGPLASGGPAAIPSQQFFIGINDAMGQNPSGVAFSPMIFNVFDAWSNLATSDDPRASIARGQVVFNTIPIQITNVTGLNDTLGQSVINGNCGTCHDSPNVGNRSVGLLLGVGNADVPNPQTNPIAIGYLPIYTLQNTTTGATAQTTDPGLALITGKWSDIGKIKVPVLRGLSGRGPYFHNGAAPTLNDVVNFYQSRFSIQFTAQQKTDLVNFLGSL